MARVVVRCLWRFFEVDDFEEAVNLGHTLECTMWLDQLQAGEGYDAIGYALLPLIIAADEEKFLLTYGNTLNLYGYVECIACDIVELSPDQLNPQEAVHPIRGDVFIGGLIQMYGRNRYVRDEEFLWALTEWTPQKSDPLKLRDILLNLVQDQRIAVFYETKNPRFYLKILNYPGFQERLDEIEALVPLDYVYLVAKRYDRMKSVESWIEALPQLTPDTIDTFLSEIAKYL